MYIFGHSVYHKVQVAVDEEGEIIIKVVEEYKNVCNGFIGQMSCFFKSISTPHWLLQMIGIFCWNCCYICSIDATPNVSAVTEIVTKPNLGLLTCMQ